MRRAARAVVNDGNHLEVTAQLAQSRKLSGGMFVRHAVEQGSQRTLNHRSPFISVQTIRPSAHPVRGGMEYRNEQQGLDVLKGLSVHALLRRDTT